MPASFDSIAIIGTWKVVKIGLDTIGLAPEMKQAAELMKSSFMKSTFIFKPDHHIDYLTDIKDLQVKNAHWKYAPASTPVR